MPPHSPYDHHPSTLDSLTTHLTTLSIPHTRDPHATHPTTTSTTTTTTTPPPPPPLLSPQPLHPLTILPSTTAQVSQILRACYARRIAVTALAGGTAFGSVPALAEGVDGEDGEDGTGGVCISFARMDRVLRVGVADRDVEVQAGVGWVGLNEVLEREGSGLWFGVDPGVGARVGGMIATSCSGTNAYRYGTMKENVISLTCVLANGDIIKTHHRPRKSSAGYDLTHLIIGSEGTLALVTEAVLRLHPLPQNLHAGIATFPTLDQAVNMVIALQSHGHQLEALELADALQMHCVNHSGLAALPMPELPTLFFKLASPSPHLVATQLQALESLCRTHQSLSFEATNDPQRIDQLWAARKCMATALMVMKKDPSDLFLHSDCAVPISRLAALVHGTQELVQAAGTARGWFCANVGHVGDGNVHSSIVCPAGDRDEAERVLREVARLALRLEGTITGEHGIGWGLRDMLEEEVGSVGVRAMRSLKKAWDERGILNPNRVFKLVEEGEEVVVAAEEGATES